MPQQADTPQIWVKFSVQNDGELVGIHWELPMLNQVIGLPISIAETLAKEFGPNLERTLKEAERFRLRSGLVVAPAETMKTLKGK